MSHTTKDRIDRVVTRLVNAPDLQKGEHLMTLEDIEVDAAQLWTYPSRMDFTLSLTDPELGKGDGPAGVIHHLYPGKPVVFNKDEHFLLRDTNNMLDVLVSRLPKRPNGKPVTYGLITFELKNRKVRRSFQRSMEKMMGLSGKPAKGFTDRKTGMHYRVIYLLAMDKGFAILVNDDCGVTHPRDLGMKVSGHPMTDKRVRRFKAPHELMLEFTITRLESTPDGRLYHMSHPAFPGRDFTCLNFDMSTLTADEEKYVDGMHGDNLHYRLFGRKYAHVKFTAILPGVGLAKGYGHANPKVKYDVVLYGVKNELIIDGDKAYFGVLGHVGLHDANMDPQTFINMGFYEDDLATAEARYWMGTGFTTLMTDNNDPAVRDLFAGMAHLKEELSEDEWALMRAMRLGVGAQFMPALRRRLFNTVFIKAIDPTEGRWPMTRYFKRLELAPNPLAFTETGRPSEALDELGEDVCAMDMDEGLMLHGRNPNANRNEAVALKNRHLKALRRYRGCGLCFYGFAAAVKYMVRLNGADFDDPIWATTEKRFIDKWLSLSYPVVDKVQPPAGAKPVYGEWTFFDAKKYLQRWVEPETELGTYIIRVMLSTMLSGENKVEALANLEAKIRTLTDPAEVKRHEDALAAFRAFPEHLLAREANNADIVIDWLQARKGHGPTASELITRSAVIETAPVFPWLWQKLGRIPAARRKKGDYVLVVTKACKAIMALEAERNEYIEKARVNEFEIARPIPDALMATFPAHDAVRANATALGANWRARWDALNEEYEGKGVPMPPIDVCFKLVCEGPERQLGEAPSTDLGFNHDYRFDENGEPWDDQFRRATSVEMYRRRYAKPRSAERTDGKKFGYPDGLPNPVLADFLTALEQAGLTGVVAFVQLTGRSRLDLTGPVVVKVTNHRVVRLENGVEMGTCPRHTPVPDGTYTMSPKGVIVVAEADPELRSTFKRELETKLTTGAIEMATPDEDEDFEFSF